MQVSELRFWTKARTQNEIANDMYVCDPQSDGLEAYWKMNEGKRRHLLRTPQATATTGKAATLPVWIPNVRIDGK